MGYSSTYSSDLATDRLSPITKRRILVIDDEADIRESLELLLTAENYVVELAENATAECKSSSPARSTWFCWI